MKRVPNFYRKNAAVGAVRRSLDRTRANEQDTKETVEQVAALCIAMAAVSVMGWDEEQRDNYLRCEIRCIEDYNVRCAAHRDVALVNKWLDGLVEGLCFVLPANGNLKRRADREELDRKRLYADRAWKLWAAALVAPAPCGMEIGREKAQSILDEARDYYRDRFLTAAVLGDGYGMEQLRRDAENVLGDAAQLALGAEKTVYSNRVW